MGQDDSKGQPERRDFFISYTSSDRQWAEWIAMELEQAGYTLFIQAWDFRPGSNFVVEMDKAAKCAERTLLVLSPAYLESEYTSAEWAASFRLGPTGVQRHMLPVRIQPCAVEGLLGPLVYIDLVQLSEEQARERLLAGIQKERVKPAMVAFPRDNMPHAVFPSSLPTIWNNPFDEGEQVDMGEAPYIDHFHGRVDELAILRRWVVDDHCHVVSIIGMGGIGKTSLVAKLIDHDSPIFETVFWRSLLNAPPLERILQEYLQFLTQAQQIMIPQDTAEQMRLLVAQFRKRRCLFVLDNAEAILKSGSSTGEYKDGYEGYGKLIRLLGETRHQGCLLVTSREQLREIALLEGERTSVHSYRLEGLKVDDARTIFEEKGLSGEENAWKMLVERFSGNPIMLTVISLIIRESYQGLISQYLKELGDVPLNEYPDLHTLLDRQFERLSLLEQQVLYWLAIEREAITLQDLRENSVQPVSKMSMLTGIEALRRRSLIEQSGSLGESKRYTLQPAIMEVVTDRFTERVVQEILSGEPNLFASYTLMKAHAKDYIRESQFQLILNVIAQKLFATLGRRKLEEMFQQKLIALRNLPEQQSTYEAGNILNLLVQTGSDLRGADFSRLVVQQAYLQRVELPEVNFAYADLATSVFTDTFGSILSVALNPDGNLLAAGTATGEVRFWHTASGSPLQTLQGHTDWVWSVAFSPDGKTLASGSEDETVRVWEVSNGQCSNILQGHTNIVRSVAFSPDGRTLASGSDDKTIRIWEVSNGQCSNILQGHTNIVRSVAFSPDGKTLASGSDDNTIRIWEVSNGQCSNILQGHTNVVRSVAFSPDGRTVASGSEDETVRIWEVSNGQCSNILQGHTNVVISVAFSPDGRTLASGSVDETVRIWEVSSRQCLHILYGHTSVVSSVAFSLDGRTLASGGYDHTVCLWEMSSRQCLHTLHGYSRWVTSVAFSPDGKTLASGSEDLTVRLWEISSGKCLHTLHGHSQWVWFVAFSPDGKTLASSSYDHTVRLWEISSGKCLHTLHGHSQWVTSVDFSPDGKTLASGSEDETVRLWEMSSHQCLYTLHGHGSAVSSVAFSPDGKILASGSYDKTVRLWEMSNHQCFHTIHGHASAIWSVAFSPDGKILASSSDDGIVRLWDVSSYQCCNVLQGHARAVSSIAFSPDGSILASSSFDHTVRLWEISSGKCLHILHSHSHWVSSVDFSPDGKTLASGGYDEVINLWNKQTGKCLRTLRSNRPYERMNITQVKGLTNVQKAALKFLGAIEEEGQELTLT